MADQMHARLLALFRPLGMAPARAAAHGASTGLSTDFILGQFRDVGDHLAPLFRQTLRAACEKRADGRWYLR